AKSKLSRIGPLEKPRTVFAFSYAAREILQFARSRGWQTVLGQIDGGPREERIVSGLGEENRLDCNQLESAPAEYWKEWREECALADRIVVNSTWSQSLVEAEGVLTSKLRVVPLAYEGSSEAAEFRREYPEAFTSARPLRVLFLGSICRRKGIRPLF